MRVNDRFPKGIKDSVRKQRYLISDNSCQPTSQKFMKACSVLGVKQILTTWSNPKGNSYTERILRKLMEELVWPYKQRLGQGGDAHEGLGFDSVEAVGKLSIPEQEKSKKQI